MADLKGKIALVTNAGCSVGAGIAQGLAEAGATIYLAGSSLDSRHASEPATLEATAARVEQLGGRGIVHALDQNDDAAVTTLFERIRREQDGLDLLVNVGCQCPADEPGATPFWRQPLSVWDEYAGNALRSAYSAAVKAADMMVAANRGLIVNLSLLSASEDSRDIAYGVMKVGLDQLTSGIAQALLPHKVTALALRAGLVTTPAVLAGIRNGTLPADVAKAQSPRFIGRCIAALAMDPDIAEKTGGSYAVASLATEYRFSDPQRQQES